MWAKKEILIIFFMFFYSCTVLSQIKDDKILDKLESSKQFEDIFIKVRDIRFKSNTELIVAEITNIDVSKNGKILVQDDILGSVFLFDADGTLLETIDQEWMERIEPGIKFKPGKALFDKQDYIYIQPVIAPKGILFRFDDKLNIVGKIEFHKINNAYSFKFNNENSLICYIVDSPEDIFLKLIDIKKHQSFRFGTFPNKFKNTVFRCPVEGLTIDKNSYIYQINPVEPTIYIYNNNGKLIKVYNKVPSFYKKIQMDYTQSLPIYDISEMKKILNWTWTWSVNFVAPYFLILQYYDQPSKKIFIDLWDIYGNCYTNGVETSEKKILAANEKSVFVAHQPPMEKDGKLPNPNLVEYKLNVMK